MTNDKFIAVYASSTTKNPGIITICALAGMDGNRDAILEIPHGDDIKLPRIRANIMGNLRTRFLCWKGHEFYLDVGVLFFKYIFG